MKASVDTNVLIHLYRADKQKLMFDMFDEVYIDGFIFNIELKNHGGDIISTVKADIESGRITLCDKNWLLECGIDALYTEYLEEEKILYDKRDQGEAAAIALARVTGAVSLLTDDTKTYGPHFTLRRRRDVQIIPLAYYEMIILTYIAGGCTSDVAIEIFEEIHKSSPDQSFSFLSKLKLFVTRFISEPTKDDEKNWFDAFCCEKNATFPIYKLKELYKKLKQS